MPLGRRYDAYLFDLDGTLVDTAPDINAALNHALVSCSLATVPLALTRDFVGMGSVALIERALNHNQLSATTTDATRQTLLTSFLGYYEQNLATHSVAYDGTFDALAELRRRGARLAVVTNKNERLAHGVLEALDLLGEFAAVVCHETTDNPKPAADPALFACRALAVDPSDALFVGDASPDVGCARAAGCTVVVRREGYNNGIPAAELGADAVIDSLTELLHHSAAS